MRAGGLDEAAGPVRGEIDVGQAPQLGVERERFLIEHVQGGVEVAAPETVQERFAIDQRGAANVHQDGALRQPLDAGGVQQLPGAGVGGRAENQDLGVVDELIQRNAAGGVPRQHLRGNVGVVDTGGRRRTGRAAPPAAARWPRSPPGRPAGR